MVIKPLFVSLLAITILLTGCGGGGNSYPASPTTPPATATAACANPAGRLLEVGPGKAYAKPSQAAAAAQDGDTIWIAAGNYTGDVAVWYKANLTICGVGGRASLYANGAYAAGKGTWVAAGNNMVVENINFHDAKVPDKNGAGIRVEPGISLTVRNCGFYDNEDGILAGNAGGTIVIENAEFARNGYGDGYSHGMYIGQIDKLVVKNSFFHETRIGHNLKSRAKESTVENSYFMDGPTGTASYQMDFPNGGQVFLRGNLLHKGPVADNSTALSYGAEGLGKWATNTLEIRHNTVVMTRSGGAFMYVNASAGALTLKANLFAGTGATYLNGMASNGSAVTQQDNTVLAASVFTGADNTANPNFWPGSGAALVSASDSAYLQDSPTPLQLRTILGSSRYSGALQRAP